MPGWKMGDDHIVVFGATPIGGTLAKKTPETLDAGFFSADNLPAALLPWHRQRIQDALDGKTGVVYRQDATWPFDAGLTRADLYRQRDESGLSKHDFLRQFMTGFSLNEHMEIDGYGG